MTSPNLSQKLDLAGYCTPNPNYTQTRARINYLVERYLSLDILSERLLDLPIQFSQPNQRNWTPIHWQEIKQNQIIGVEAQIFLLVIASAVEIETPIRDYAQESWGYIQQTHPQLARFVGGIYDENGKITEVGVWEKEERQHAPAFGKIYQQLTGEKLKPVPNSVQGYQASDNVKADIYHHAISRIATEWSAVSIYLWLMAHSTGELQKAIAQPLQDEVNHLAKFWGMSRWGFGNSAMKTILKSSQQLLSLSSHHQQERSHSQDLLTFSHLNYSLEIAFTFIRVILQLNRWNCHLKTDALQEIFGSRN